MGDLDMRTENKTITCEKHGEVEVVIQHFGKKQLGGKCELCQAESQKAQDKEARAAKARQRQYVIEKRLGRAGIPKRFMNREFSNYACSNKDQRNNKNYCEGYAQHFEKMLSHGAGIVMCGRPGTGKNHLATAIAKKVINSGRTAVFETAIGITRDVKSTYRAGSERTCLLYTSPSPRDRG